MKDEIVHILFHFFIPFLLLLFYLYFYKEVKIENIIIIFLGSFFPDIDHIVYLKYKKSIKEFLKYNIFSDRYRKGILIFHNIYFMIFLIFITLFSSLYSLSLFLFFLSFFLHLLVDFLDDKFTIRTIEHWRKIK